MYKFFLATIFAGQLLMGQNVSEQLARVTKNLLDSPSATAANVSLYVADEQGNLVYEFNGNKGLSSASTQKIFTAAAALETLGKDFRYTTTVSFSGKISAGRLDGDLFVKSSGDPTLGSWRYDGYKPEDFKQKLLTALKNAQISAIAGDLVIDDSEFDFQATPGGWPWDDMGNYYGAGVWGVNWRENQFDLNMNGKEIKNVNVPLPNVKWVNDLKTGGSADQSLIFTAPHSEIAYINGTLPAKSITVSGAMPNPPLSLGAEIEQWLKESKIAFSGKIISSSSQRINAQVPVISPKNNVILTYDSPKMEKIIYWFLRKSVNLYGETLIKTLGKEKKNEGSFQAGISVLRDFWKSKGINAAMINFADGSGLSPQNYVSAKAEVQALLYSKKQPWFAEFYDGFPVQSNGMKMKSGTMKDTKSFAGYHNSKAGKKYVYAIILNNYQGSNISDALFKILNNLK